MGTLSVQMQQSREIAELRWDGASELIRGKVPERDNERVIRHKPIES